MHSDVKAKVCAPMRRQTLHLPSGWESSPSGVFACYCAGTAIVMGSSANVRPGLDALCKSASYARPTPIPTRMVLTMWSLVHPFEHGCTIRKAGGVDVLARQVMSMCWQYRSAGSSEQRPMVSSMEWLVATSGCGGGQVANILPHRTIQPHHHFKT